jgi:hypothetical protein
MDESEDKRDYDPHNRHCQQETPYDESKHKKRKYSLPQALKGRRGAPFGAPAGVLKGKIS